MPLTIHATANARAADALGGRQIRLDHAPFLIGHIALVAQTVAAIVLAGGWGPHGISEWCQQPLGITSTQSLNPFETAFRGKITTWDNG